MSDSKNNTDFDFVPSWAGAIAPGKIIMVGKDKSNRPVWAKVTSNKAVGYGLCEPVLEISYRLLVNGEEGSDQFYEGEEVIVGS